MNSRSKLKYSISFFLLIFSLSHTSCDSDSSLDSISEIQGSKYSIHIFGDSRDGPDIYSRLLDISNNKLQNNAMIHLGDLISSPSDSEQLPIFYELTRNFVGDKDFYIAPGNHDINDEKSMSNLNEVYNFIGQKGYYHRQLGSCFCIFLNSEDLAEGAGIGAEQLTWLEEVASSQEAQQSSYRMVLIHRPLFPQNHHKDEELAGNETLHAIFIKHKINAVFSGHEHSYSHIKKDNIDYIITGGAGSPIYSPAGPSSAFYHFIELVELEDSLLNIRAIDFLGATKDEFQISI